MREIFTARLVYNRISLTLDLGTCSASLSVNYNPPISLGTLKESSMLHLISQIVQITFVCLTMFGVALVMINKGRGAVQSFAICLFLMFALVAQIVKADTIWLEKKPSSSITAGQASKQGLKADGTVWQCRAKVIGKNGNPVATKGSTNSFHAGKDIGKDVETAADTLADGKPMVECHQVYTDKESKRLKKWTL